MTSSANKPLRKPDYRLENMDNELLLFNPNTTNVLYMNESASVIWQLCDGQRTVPEIIDLLVNAYPEAAASIPADVHETIDLFMTNGAIQLV